MVWVKGEAEINEYEASFAVAKKQCQDLTVELNRTKEEFTAFERRDIKLQVNGSSGDVSEHEQGNRSGG